MKIIVTAGGTSEPIDQVRAISNHATGRLGSMIADEFLSHMQEDDQLYYLCGEHAVLPSQISENLTVIQIGGTNELLEQVKSLLHENKIDVFVHSMAVSDFAVKQIAPLPAVADTLFQQKNRLVQMDSSKDFLRLMQEAIEENRLCNDSKLSSATQNPIVTLEKTPKIIGEIKRISKNTKLVGFKLLCGVSKEELIDTAFQLLVKNDCDYVFANDIKSIDGNSHDGYLIFQDGSAVFLQGKRQIAQEIVKRIRNSMEANV